MVGKIPESVEKFSSDRGAPLRRVVNNWDFTLTNTSTYKTTNNDSPVAMLNSSHLEIMNTKHTDDDHRILQVFGWNKMGNGVHMGRKKVYKL